MKVVWTESALRHLVSIYEYIANDSPTYALRMTDRITGRTQQIGPFPKSGRTVPEYETADIREVIERPYRIIYRVKPEVVEVLAIVHGARLLPPLSEEGN